MQSQTSDNSGLKKLKSIFFLGLSCNQTTILGCILVWIFLSRNELSSFWNNLMMVLSVMPFFMGDAVNNYVLGRIKLEKDNNWNDICMTSNHKAFIAKLYVLYRAFSIISAYGIAIIMVYIMTIHKIPQWLWVTVATVAGIHFVMALHSIIKGIAPVIPDYKKRGLVFRGIFMVLAIAIWGYFLRNTSIDNISLLFVFTSGILYFVFCGIMHPLPAKGTLLQSIIKESILAQAQAEARARTSSKEELLYNIKEKNIEDASIVETNEQENNKEVKEIKNNDVPVTPSEENTEISDAIVVTTENSGEINDEH